MTDTEALQLFQKHVGREIGVGEWLTVDQDRINTFADSTGDHQWIHVDEEKASRGPFGKTIAHGYMTVALIPLLTRTIRLNTEDLKISMGVNYGMNKVRLINPVMVNSRIRARSVLSAVAEKGPGRILQTNTITIEIEGEEKPAGIVETLTMLFVT